jgi:DNA polymerase III alpha subunit
MGRSIVSNRGDIDIDFADRSKALEGMSFVPASIIKDGRISKHNTGVYFHAAPMDPVTGLCSIDYEDAERRGMFKIDMLNVSIYELVRDEDHLLDLMERSLDWSVFEDKEFVSKLFHLGNHSELTARLKPRSIEQLAMILALIRPGKKHLQRSCIDRGFGAIEGRIWLQADDEYVFKKSHAVGYAMLVYVHANLLLELSNKDAKLTV